MRIHTKEWHELFNFIGTLDMFEPVIDKEYSDEEIEELHRDMLEKYVQEEELDYDEPPFFDEAEWIAENPADEFDPEDYLIGIIDENGEETDLRHPESYEELLEYQKAEFLNDLDEYEDREPFDREEAVREFEEDYQEALEYPDPDIPAWIRESVDPRLVALGLLPEGVYKKLRAEEEEKTEEFDALDEKADKLEDEYDELFPEEYEYLVDEFDDIVGDYIMSASLQSGNYELEVVSWDEDGNQVRRIITFENAEMLENEEPDIHSWTDEDGDVESDCELGDFEIYFEDGKIEMHMLLDNGISGGFRYVTISCDSIVFG